MELGGLRLHHPSANRPSLRTLAEDKVAALLAGGFEALPDDCSAIVHAGSYGAAVRVPGSFTISGIPGGWVIDSDEVQFSSNSEVAPIARPFVGSRFLKVSCGHQLFYSSQSYHLILCSPPNIEPAGFRVWTGLQTVPYRDVAERDDGLRQFNTNVIIEPLSPCTVERGTVLAVIYLLPRTFEIVELEQ
jgi:hypothetical protein